MKKMLLPIMLLASTAILGFARHGGGQTVVDALVIREDKLQNGDIIFETSLSVQSKAIQTATHSKYSHCGIIYKNRNGYFVLEAVQPVKLTPLGDWIAKGAGKHYVIKRLKNAHELLTSKALKKLEQVGEEFIGRDYDLTFEWSDDKIYCSELIWKIYYSATGLEVGKLQKLGDFDLTSAIVKKKMVKRYGNRIPRNEQVISSASIFNSDLLQTIATN